QLRDRELLERRTNLLTERDELNAEIERLTAKAQASAAELEVLRDHREQSAKEQTASQARLNELKPQKTDLTRRVHELRNEVQLKRNRLKVLQDLHRRLEGVGAGTKALLSFADPAVVGILADRLEVNPRFTDALAGLLGERLQCVIVSDPVRGLELLDQLKRQQRGRATIAIQTNLRDTPAPAVIAADEPTV